MPIHCTTGQIARVTFPDNSVRDFPDTPIDIAVKAEYSRCTRVTISYRVFFEFNGSILTHNATVALHAPFSGLREDPSREGIVQALCHGISDQTCQ
jgi:hypothetical protein